MGGAAREEGGIEVKSSEALVGREGGGGRKKGEGEVSFVGREPTERAEGLLAISLLL